MKLAFKNWFEVTTISNNSKDDEFFEKQMIVDYNRVKDRESSVKIGNIKNIEMLSTNYPYGNKIFFLVNDSPIGFAVVQKENWPEGPNKVSLIYITTSYRRMGIGTAFHKFLLNSGPLQGDTHMTLAMQGLWNKLNSF